MRKSILALALAATALTPTFGEDRKPVVVIGTTTKTLPATDHLNIPVLAGSGTRCSYVDASGTLQVKTGDCAVLTAGVLPIAQGGTNAATAADARTSLGVTATGADTTYAYRANNLSDLTSASTARTNLGLGTAATQATLTFLQAANNLSDVTAATARTNLGLGTFATQSYASPPIIGGTTPAAGHFTTLSATGNLTTNVTGSTQCLHVDSAGVISGMGADCGTSSSSGTVTTVSVASANGFAGSVANASSTPAITISTSITGLLKGNGTAVSAASAGTDYYAPGGTDVAVADGGTGSSTASAARTALGLAIGTDVQAYDADLTTYAGITPSANVQTLLGAANYSAFRTSLGVAIGTDVQAYDADLAALGGVTSAADKCPYFTGSGTASVVTCSLAGRTLMTNGYVTESLCVAASDESTAITTGTAKVTFRMPYAFTVTDVRASVNTAPTGSTILIDINEGGTTIISTKLMIDASEKTSTTAATPAVISDSSLADDAEMTIDFDQVGSTIAGKGVKVCLIGHQ